MSRDAPADCHAAAHAEARDTLMRALERLDEVRDAGLVPDVVVVAIGARGLPDSDGNVREIVGYEASPAPGYARAGVLTELLRRVRAAGG